MSWFSIYIFGACISGFIFLLLTYIDSFYDYLNDSIYESIEEIKKSDKYSQEEKILLDQIDFETVIKFLNIVICILSWGGILIDIIYVLAWIIESIKNKFIK